ncbi:GcrA family cell cycle regulator [Lichenibacterium dinghuense]|uniref:GcrA family cell cycle regulator n=1 Tax=Lichenibacterium dinghuense TaxID=2895977 RepID=UPI001F161071|nr:GcrA family cell cycle regulator [Lichenibacterium sp. 6Y81]
MSWTDERVERLSALWLEGRSASQIAIELGGGVSRNAVIGKVHRLGLSGRAVPQPEEPAPPRIRDVLPVEVQSEPPVAVEAAPVPAEASAARSEPPAAAAHTVDDVASILDAAPEPITVSLPVLRAAREVGVPLSDRVTILELSGSMCRWPIGDPTSAEFRFCGCRAVGTLPYCQEHARVAFQPVADRRRTERLIRIA